MARLATLPYEIGPGIANGTLETFINGTVTVDTSVRRSPGASYKYDSASGAAETRAFYDVTTVLGRRYYQRAYFCFRDLPDSAISIFTVVDGLNVVVGSVRLTTTGKLQLWNDVAGTQIGSDSAVTIEANSTTWYRIEMSCTLGTGAVDLLEARVDGVVIASGSSLAVSDQTVNYFSQGWHTNPGSNKVLWTDDGAINDDQGTDQTSYPGGGNVIILLPVSDSSRAGFTGGAGGTTSLFEGVNNTPPIGVASGSATDLTQIKNPGIANTTDNYIAKMMDYVTAGMPSNSVVTLIQMVKVIGVDAATAMSTGMTPSNPTGAEKQNASSAAIAGTWDTNWQATWHSPYIAPLVTPNVQPTLKIRRATSNAAVAIHVALMGLVVEYVPAPLVHPFNPIPFFQIGKAA